MNFISFFFLLQVLQQSEIIGLVKSKQSFKTFISSNALNFVKASIPERRLDQIQLVKGYLDKNIGTYFWTASEPINDKITVSETINKIESPVFEVLIVAIANSQQKYLVLQNKASDLSNLAFDKYKHAQLIFKRKFTDSDSNLVEPYVRNCIEQFKKFVDSVNSQTNIPSLYSQVKAAIDESKNLGLEFVSKVDENGRDVFLLNLKSGQTRFRGNIYKVSDDEIGVSLTGNGESFLIYSSQNINNNLKERITTYLTAKMASKEAPLTITDLKDKVMEQINLKCTTDSTTFVIASSSDTHVVIDIKTNQPVQTPAIADKNTVSIACIYANSKVTLVNYLYGKIQYFHVFVDIAEFQTEDLILPNPVSFDEMLKKSFDRNYENAMMVRTSQASAKKEYEANEKLILETLVIAFDSPAEEAEVNETEKFEFEKEGGLSFVHGWNFKNGKNNVKLFKNKNEFVIEVSRLDGGINRIASTMIAIPFYNGYDQLGLVQKQIKDFLASR